MTWHEVLNHDPAFDRFQRSLDRNRLASTYLFVGPSGIGKRHFAMKLAEALLCETTSADQIEACGRCPSCQQVQGLSHPDLILVSKPIDKAFIPLEVFIGDKEHRRREGLCHDIGLKPFRGGRKIAIIDDADFLNQEGANSLLKTLEEPPPNSLLILVGTSEQRQLSTIVSRSQVVRFQPLTNVQVEQVLKRLLSTKPEQLPQTLADKIESLRELHATDPNILNSLAQSAGGSIELALRLANPEILQFRNQLFAQLATRDPAAKDFGSAIVSFLDGDGKDGAKKRARLVMLGDFAIEFYRHWIVRLAGAQLDEERHNPSLDSLVDRAVAPYAGQVETGVELAGRCVERTTEMQQQVQANASAGNLVEAWLRDLGRICRRDFAVYGAH